MNTIPIAFQYVTLTQPWASLMAFDHKRIETRSWSTNFRGLIAIHAAKGFPRGCRDLCEQSVFANALAEAGYRGPGDLPLGRVLAVVDLYDCVSTARLAAHLSMKEFVFGDYSAGRFAWETRGVRRLREPFEMRGLQRIQRLSKPIYEVDLL